MRDQQKGPHNTTNGIPPGDPCIDPFDQLFLSSHFHPSQDNIQNHRKGRNHKGTDEKAIHNSEKAWVKAGKNGEIGGREIGR